MEAAWQGRGGVLPTLLIKPIIPDYSGTEAG